MGTENCEFVDNERKHRKESVINLVKVALCCDVMQMHWIKYVEVADELRCKADLTCVKEVKTSEEEFEERDCNHNHENAHHDKVFGDALLGWS